MEQAELLQTLAEVSIAFAGFAGIAAIFGRRYIRDDPRVQQERLRGMIQSSLTGCFFSVFPFIPFEFGLSEVASWRLSSGFLAAVWVIIAFAMLRRSHVAGIGLGPHPVLAVATLGFGSLVVGGLTLNAAGLFANKPGAFDLSKVE